MKFTVEHCLRFETWFSLQNYTKQLVISNSQSKLVIINFLDWDPERKNSHFRIAEKTQFWICSRKKTYVTSLVKESLSAALKVAKSFPIGASSVILLIKITWIFLGLLLEAKFINLGWPRPVPKGRDKSDWDSTTKNNEKNNRDKRETLARDPNKLAGFLFDLLDWVVEVWIFCW